mgnify:CR=1 FL=1|jgi:hypothetical protein
MSDIPESKTTDYSDYLDEIINELMRIKNSLKRGRLRKENRKEVSHLQNAISALRHLRNKNNRHVDKMILDSQRELTEQFSYNDIKLFLMGKSRNED